VWQWRRRYDSPVLDGEQWELTLAAGVRSKKCYGSNAYPGFGGKPVELRHTKAFRGFVAAVRELVGEGEGQWPGV
jgi:hypothetical protein